MVKAVGKSMKEQGNGFGEDLAGKREMQVFKMFFSPYVGSSCSKYRKIQCPDKLLKHANFTSGYEASPHHVHQELGQDCRLEGF